MRSAANEIGASLVCLAPTTSDHYHLAVKGLNKTLDKFNLLSANCAPGASDNQIYIVPEDPTMADENGFKNPTVADKVLSWTSSDPRSSVLFDSSFNVDYRFVTVSALINQPNWRQCLTFVDGSFFRRQIIKTSRPPLYGDP